MNSFSVILLLEHFKFYIYILKRHKIVRGKKRADWHINRKWFRNDTLTQSDSEVEHQNKQKTKGLRKDTNEYQKDNK